MHTWNENLLILIYACSHVILMYAGKKGLGKIQRYLLLNYIVSQLYECSRKYLRVLSNVSIDTRRMERTLKC